MSTQRTASATKSMGAIHLVCFGFPHRSQITRDKAIAAIVRAALELGASLPSVLPGPRRPPDSLEAGAPGGQARPGRAKADDSRIGLAPRCPRDTQKAPGAPGVGQLT